mmetsp:Transcript_3830/g.7848  ORF Transcript_3830/g.7848 Transcript_3830/m.7848 type:complete len:116 (-) Transcript_3830:909-1256(-)
MTAAANRRHDLGFVIPFRKIAKNRLGVMGKIQKCPNIEALTHTLAQSIGPTGTHALAAALRGTWTHDTLTHTAPDALMHAVVQPLMPATIQPIGGVQPMKSAYATPGNFRPKETG